MNTATRRMSIPSLESQRVSLRVLSGQTLSQKLAKMLLVDVLASKSHAADEMSSELLEHVWDCKECLAASIAGACGSSTCAQRPNRDGFDLSAGPTLATDPGISVDLHRSNAILWKAIPDFQPLGSVSPLGEIDELTQPRIRRSIAPGR